MPKDIWTSFEDSDSPSECPEIITTTADYRRACIQRSLLMRLRETAHRTSYIRVGAFTVERIKALDSEIAELTRRVDAFRSQDACTDESIECTHLKNLPAKIISARLRRRLSKRDLARQVGISPAQLARYERTKYAAVTLKRIIEIIDAINRHPDVWRHQDFDTNAIA